MVTVTLQGGLGNQMFMMAAAMGYAAKHNMPYAIPLRIENPHYQGQKPYIFPGIRYADEKFDPRSLPLFQKAAFTYQEIPYMENICLNNSYWQSYKYYDHCKEEFIKALGFPYHFKKGIVGIQVRRGDYVRLADKHPPVSEAYLYAVVNLFFQKGYREFNCYSDDQAWCRSVFSNPQYADCTFHYPEGEERAMMADLSGCEHMAMANSSFGYWAAELNQNPNKIICYPEKWFGPAQPLDTRDLCRPEWIKIQG